MQATRAIDLWVAPEKAHDVFGKIANSTVTFETGGNIWVPAQPDHHMLRGLKYTASGTPQQLQQLLAKLIAQSLEGGQQLDSSGDTQQWLYLNEQGTQYGPFSGKQLHKWNSSGSWPPDFSVCHGPSGIWLPVWLVLQLLGFPAAIPPAAAEVQHQAGEVSLTAGLSSSNPVQYGATSGRQHQQQHTVTSHHMRHCHASGGQRTQGYHHVTQTAAGDDDEYGWRSPQQPVSAATAPAAAAANGATGGNSSSHAYHASTYSSQATAAAAGGSAPAAAVGQYGTDEGCRDAEMLDWHAEVMHELQLLRHDSEFLQELNRAVDMEWEPQQQQAQGYLQQQQGLQGGSGEPADTSAGTAADSNWLPQQQQQWANAAGSSSTAGLLVLVVDTNVLLDRRGLAVLQQLQETQQQCAQQLLVVIPWTVLVELDKLKARQGGLDVALLIASQARAALRHLQSVMAPDSPHRDMYRAQSIQEFRSAAHDVSFGVPDKLMVADDRILQCAMSCQKQLQQQQQQHQQEPAFRSGLLLLTNDVAFRLKAQANGLRVASVKDLPASGHLVQQQQQLLAQLMHLAGMTGVASSGRNEAPATAQPAAGLAPDVQQQWPAPAAVQLHPQPQQHQQILPSSYQSSESGEELALSHITSLRLGLTGKVTTIFKKEYDELWLDVVSSKPPWRDGDFLHLLHKHWRSTLQDHLQPAAKHNKQQLEVAVQYLIDVNKQLHNRCRSSSCNSRDDLQHTQQLQQNVAARVVQLLEAFGAMPAAADVASAAGFEWLRSASSTVSCGHSSWRGESLTNTTQTVRALDRLGPLDGGSHDGETSSRHLLSGTIGASMVGGSVQTVGRGGAPQALQLQAVADVDCVQCLGGASTSNRRHVHAIRHDQQALGAQTEAAAAAAVNGISTAAVGINQEQFWKAAHSVQPRQQPQQHNSIVAGAQAIHHHQQQQQGQGLQRTLSVTQQVVPSIQHQQQPQQQQQAQLHLADQQQRPTWQTNAIAQLALACGAVPVPQPQLGPCFKLQQLVAYTIALFQTAVPVLQQLHTSQPAAVAEMISAVKQRVQGILQLMAYISSTVANGAGSMGRQQALDQGSLVAVLHEPVLQLGQQLVQLCCLMLSDGDACVRVCGQLVQHASTFVADGISFCVQQRQHSDEVAFAGWQLQAALQQLQ